MYILFWGGKYLEIEHRLEVQAPDVIYFFYYEKNTHV